MSLIRMMAVGQLEGKKMEDAVDESESLVSLSDRKREVEEGQDEAENALEQESEGGEDERGEVEEGGDEEVGAKEEEKSCNDDDAESSAGGLINQIISNIPVSIPDDPSPEADEASLLIHIVHD